MVPSLTAFTQRFFHHCSNSNQKEKESHQAIKKNAHLKNLIDDCLSLLPCDRSPKILLNTISLIPKNQFSSKECQVFFQVLKKNMIFSRLSSYESFELFEHALVSYHEKVPLQLFKLGFNLKDRNQQYQTLMHLSAFHGKVQVIKKLISKGLSVNAHDHFGKTPLHLTCSHGCLEAAQLLIDHGADIESIDGNDASPLMIACKYSQAALVKLLMDSGAKLQSKNCDGNSALHIACLNNDKELVRMLLEKGADYQLLNKEGFTPKGLAVFKGYEDAAKLIPEDVYTKEFTFRKLIAHFNGIKGKSFFNDVKIRLSGAYPSYIHFKVKQYFEDYVSQVKGDLTDEEVQTVLKAFEGSLHKRSSKEIVESIRNGLLTIVSTGWKYHTLDLVFFKEYFAICNGGEGIPENGKTITVLSINPHSFNENAIEEIIQGSCTGSKTRIPYFYETIPQECTLGKTETCTFFEKFSNKEIKIGTCSMAAAKIALRVSRLFYHFSNRPFQPEYEENHQLSAKIIVNFTKNFSTFARIRVQMEYLEEGLKTNFNFIDSSLISQSIEKVRMRLQKDPDPHPYLIQKFEELSQKYAVMLRYIKEKETGLKTRPRSFQISKPLQQAEKRFKSHAD